MMDELRADIRFSILPDWVIASDVSDRAVRIYAVLAGFADNETLTAFPSRALLAKRVNSSLKSVDRALRELVDIGAIALEKRIKDGVYQSSLYTIKRGGVGTPVTLGRDTGDARVGPPVTHRTITNELEPLNYINIRFDEFWNVYPLKREKPKARRAFEKAVKRVDDAVTIVVAAASYRDDPNRVDKYTKYPATWLNNDCWNDGPLPVRGELTNNQKNLLLIQKLQATEQSAVERGNDE